LTLTCTNKKPTAVTFGKVRESFLRNKRTGKDKINKKDIFIIVYVPNAGVSVYKNGSKKGTIEGLDFKKALFGIWLGNNPADDDLKAGMLGK
jgi:hypothetical protein